MFQPQNISSPEQIATACKEIQDFIEARYNADNPNAVLDRANTLESYMAWSGKMLADAEHHYNKLVESSIMEALTKAMETKLSTSTLNKYVESIARDYKFLVTWCDRINRSCTHQLDFARTVISKIKAEMLQIQRA